MVDPCAVLRLWRLRCIRATIQHYAATCLFRAANSGLTFINVAASISVLYFSVIEYNSSIIHGRVEIAAVITVITTVLQYILDYGTRWKAHERSGKGYASLNREIERLMTVPIDRETLMTIETHFNHITDMSPTTPRVLWNRPKKITQTISEMEEREARPSRAHQPN